MVLAAAAGFSAYSLLRHTFLQSTLYDLGIQDQVVWNTAQGRPFASSIEVRFYLADHLSLILGLFAPLYRVWPDVRLLLSLQAFALALGAYPLYRLARREVAGRYALLFPALYLLYPALGFINRFDFHAEAFVTPFLLLALWLWEERRYGAASLGLALALSCREEVGLAIALWATVQALYLGGRERRLALCWVAIGALWTVLGMGLVMPHLRGAPSDTFVACFGHLGPSYGAALLRFLRHPAAVLSESWHGLGGYKASFLPRLLLPLAFFPLLAPLSLLPLLPGMLSALFSRCLPHSTIYYQYTAPMIPFLFAGGIRGFARAARRLERQQHLLPLLLLLGTAAALAWDFPWWKPIEGPGLYPVGRPERPANLVAFHKAAALVPADAALAADNHLGPHFAHRESFYLFPYGESWRAQFVLLDLTRADPHERPFWETLHTLLIYPFYRHRGGPERTLLLDGSLPVEEVPSPWGAFGVRYFQQGILLLERGYPSEQALHEAILKQR
ncbi:MAG: DUF2079 domain-containing protein [Chloroflexia bacterium]